MTGNRRRWMPTAIVVLAVAGLAIAARRDTGLDAGTADGLWKDARVPAAFLTLVALGMVAATFTKHRDDGYGLLRRAGTATGLVLAAAAVLTPFGLVFLGRQSSAKPMPGGYESVSESSTNRVRSSAIESSAKPNKSNPLADLFAQTLLILVLAAAAFLIGYGVYQLIRWRWFPRITLPELEFEHLEDADLEQLAEAIAAGSEALAYAGDAREAVIACYAAMEDALGAEGNGRREADTPEDFLLRVTGAGLIPAEPARRLTELFREARFSQHPIDEDMRERAREALGEISEHLRQRTEQALAAVAAARSAAAAGAAGPTGSAAAGGRR
jgi:hypothetical protein